MCGALRLDSFGSERSWEEYVYQIAASHLWSRNVSVSVVINAYRLYQHHKKKTGIGASVLAKISA